MKDYGVRFVCEGCTFLFQTFTSVGRSQKIHCPKCGDYIDVVRYKAERTTKQKRGKKIPKVKWTPEEVEMVDQCIHRKLDPHQVAIQTGRTVNSVLKKLSRRKEELHDENHH